MSALTQDRRSSIAVAVATLSWAAFALIYLLDLTGDQGRPWLTNVSTFVAAWIGVYLAYRLWRSYAPAETGRRVWLAMFIGLLLWAVGEGLWLYFDLRQGSDVPYPSLADLAWTVGYFPLAIGLWLRYSSLGVRPGLGQWLALALICMVGVVAVRYVLWPILTYPGYDRPIEQILNVSYPVGDLVLLVGAVLVAGAVWGGRLSIPWLMISLGVAVLSLSDLFFSYTTWNEIYIPDGPVNAPTALVDLPYLAGDLAIALGAYLQARLEGSL